MILHEPSSLLDSKLKSEPAKLEPTSREEVSRRERILVEPSRNRMTRMMPETYEENLVGEIFWEAMARFLDHAQSRGRGSCEGYQSYFQEKELYAGCRK